MANNVGSIDRKLRTVIGAVAGVLSLAILANAVSLPEVASPVLGVVALVMLTTAAMGTCGLYALLGVDTCPANANR
ncbi:YgaP family membrane protein [Halovenus sp. HT40]|uniref:YgaP family membrane protein n=1 Tax=Halovenus sp. HT40 TaxID=3126691 RepID=UPI00300F546F